VPSIGASSGIIVIWNSAYFWGVTIDNLPFGITICFTSIFNLSSWKMMTVYGPCHDSERSEFVNWLRSHDIQDHENWFFLGDFNFYRSLENRNMTSGNLSIP
jgi:hypothetical protein